MKENPERCTRQFALIAVMNVKFHSSPIPAGQSTVEIVGRREEEQVQGTNTKARRLSNIFKTIFSKFFFIIKGFTR